MRGEWQEDSLERLIDVKHGYAFAGTFIDDEPRGDVLLTPGNFAIGGGFKADKFKYFAGPVPSDFVLQEGDLLVSMTDLSKEADTLGYPAFVPPSEDGRRYLHNQRLGKVVIRRPDLIDVTYLYYLMCTPEYRNEVLASATGTTVRHTSPDRIKRFRFRRPLLAEQRALAGVLSTLDRKSSLNRRMIATLAAMSAALFGSWFVTFDPVRAHAVGLNSGLPKDVADLFPRAFVPSELGDIPQGWDVANLGQVADVVDCLHSRKPDRRDTGRPLLQLTNIRDDGLIDMRDAYLIDEKDYTTWTLRMEAATGDCVITNVGRVGAVAQIPAGLSAALGRNMTGVRCKREWQFPTFLLECLLSEPMRKEVAMKMDTGTILEALNVRNIPRLRFVLPPRHLLELFERTARPLRARMEHCLAESRSLAALRDALLPRLISGDIRARVPARP